MPFVFICEIVSIKGSLCTGHKQVSQTNCRVFPLPDTGWSFDAPPNKGDSSFPQYPIDSRKLGKYFVNAFVLSQRSQRK